MSAESIRRLYDGSVFSPVDDVARAHWTELIEPRREEIIQLASDARTQIDRILMRSEKDPIEKKDRGIQNREHYPIGFCYEIATVVTKILLDGVNPERKIRPSSDPADIMARETLEKLYESGS